MNKAIRKRVGLLSGVVCLGLVLSGCPLDVVFFPDAALDNAVREAIDKKFGFITTADLSEVQEIVARGGEIRTLEGLQYCPSLTHLDLRNNQIQSLVQLRDLTNLVRLDLADNQLRDIEPVSGLLELQYLDLSGANQEIWDWQHLVANVTASGSALGDGGTVVLPAHTTFGSGNEPLPSFEPHLVEMESVNVTIIVAETTTGGGGEETQQ